RCGSAPPSRGGSEASRWDTDPDEPSPAGMLERGAAASRARERAPARGSRGQPGRSDEQAGQPPRPAPFVRDPIDRDGIRHPDDPGAAGASGRPHDDDLHARAEPRRAWGAEPLRRDAVLSRVLPEGWYQLLSELQLAREPLRVDVVIVRRSRPGVP